MSRFIKETFPEKWKIQIIEENFDIVTPYYAEVSTTYTTKQLALNGWIQSHNFVNETPSSKAGASFFGNDDEFTPITVEEFKEFVLMEEQFILPEKWYIKSNLTTDKVIRKYFNKEFNQKISDYKSEKGWIYRNYIDSKDSYLSQIYEIPSGITEITYDQFIKYVLNEQPITEDHSQLIKLLNDTL